jgi:hypothetical protein
MRIQVFQFIAILCIFLSCKKEEIKVYPDLRAELVNHTFEGMMNNDTRFFTDASFRFMRGCIRDPYYLISINYGEKNGSGLIEILDDNTFKINLTIEEVEYFGTGYLLGDTVSIFATNAGKSEVVFKGKRISL